MESPTNEGCYLRHSKLPDLVSTTAITPSEETFLKGLIHFNKNDFKKCIECFIESSEFGNENSEYNLGVIYEYGVSDEFPQNLDEAVHWYKKAESHGHKKAKEALKRVYNKKENSSFFNFF